MCDLFNEWSSEKHILNIFKLFSYSFSIFSFLLHISHLIDCLRLSLSLFTWFGILFCISWAISLSISWYSIDSCWYVSWRKPNATSGSWRKCILDSIKCASLSPTESCQNNFQSLWALKLLLLFINSKWRRIKT